MSRPSMMILVVGATGSIGSLVVEEALCKGHSVRALVRSPEKACRLPAKTEAVVGDLTQPDTLGAAVRDVDSIIFTHGSDGAGKVSSEAVDYGGVRNVLAALGRQKPRIALMTAFGVTNRTGSYNRSTESHDWKRRAERLVRMSGCPYLVVQRRDGSTLKKRVTMSPSVRRRMASRRTDTEQGGRGSPRSTDGLVKPSLLPYPQNCGVSIHLNQTPAEGDDSLVTSVRYQVLDIKMMNAFVARHPQRELQ